MSDYLSLIKHAFAEAWCISEHEYHVGGDEVPCMTARRVAGLEPGGNNLMDYFVVALDVHRVPGMPTYVHTYGDDFDGCSTCWDHQIDSKGPRVLCKQPVPDPEQPGICRWCKHAVSIGEYKWSNPESRAERLQRLRERTA
jgi:hypothetical protein